MLRLFLCGAVSILAGLVFPVAANAQCPAPPAFYTIGGAAGYASSGDFSLDSDGILIRDYHSEYNNLGKFRNPLFISNYAHRLYRDWYDGGCKDAELKNKFLKQADYLLRSAEWRQGMAVWSYPFYNKFFDLPAGWISGITQSLVAGVMVRAWRMTGNASYDKLVSAALLPYRRSISEGGVISFGDSVRWIEEAPDTKGRSYRILNGHITAIRGLIDVNTLVPSSDLEVIIREAIDAVSRNISLFDAGFASFYSLEFPVGEIPKAAINDYNIQHVTQLLWLFEFSKRKIFLDYALKFQSYETHGISFDASKSIAPKTNGPSKAGALYYSYYWSTSTFPAWIEAKWPESRTLMGIGVDAVEAINTPKNFSVSVSDDGLQWHRIFATRDNSKKQFYVRFSPRRASAVRLEVDQAQSNILALQAMMPVFSDRTASAISDSCNYRSSIIDGRMRYNFDFATDADDTKNMSVYCPGWIILRVRENDSLLLAGTGKADARFQIEDSDDLQNWQSAGSVPVSIAPVTFSIPRKWKSYVRVLFDGPDKISEINAVKVIPPVVDAIESDASIETMPFVSSTHH